MNKYTLKEDYQKNIPSYRGASLTEEDWLSRGFMKGCLELDVPFCMGTIHLNTGCGKCRKCITELNIIK